MEASYSSETLVNFQRTTQRCIHKDMTLHKDSLYLGIQTRRYLFDSSTKEACA